MALPLLAAMGIMAALGAIKSEAVDRPAEERKRKLKSEEQRYSPYSGIRNFTEVGPEANTLGSFLGGAAQGAGLHQGFTEADQKEAQNAAIIDALKGNDVNTVGPTNYNAWLQSQNAQPQPVTRGFLNASNPQSAGMLDNYYGF